MLNLLKNLYNDQLESNGQIIDYIIFYHRPSAFQIGIQLGLLKKISLLVEFGDHLNQNNKLKKIRGG